MTITWLTWLSWVAMTLSIAGAILNAQKKVSGFYIWIVSNVAWIIIDFAKGVPAQAIFFLFCFGTSIYGIYKWRHYGLQQ